MRWSVVQHIREYNAPHAHSDSDLSAMARLQARATQLVRSGDRDTLLKEILSAAADLTGTDKGNIQLLDLSTGHLRIVVHQGLGERFVEHFAEHGWPAACDAALTKHARVILEDVASLSQIADTEELAIVVDDGIRAIQSTPILSGNAPSLRSCVAMATSARLDRRSTDHDGAACGVLGDCLLPGSEQTG